MSTSLRQALRALVDVPQGVKPLDPLAKQGAKPAAEGKGLPKGSGAGAAGGGFDEADFTQRQYWPAVILTSSDGVFTIAVEPIKSIALTGGGTATFQQPV